MKKILLVCLIVCCYKLNAQVCFKALNTFSVTGSQSPVSIKSGNLNGNSLPDFAMADNTGNNVAVFLDYNAGTGMVASTYTYSTGTGPMDVVIGNFDNDANGYMDLLTVNKTSNNVSVLAGSGTGSFAAAVNFSTGTNSAPTTVATGDFNGDGKLDIATVNSYTTAPSTAILLNTGSVGTCSFTIATTYSTAVSSRYGIQAFDMDNDHDSDIVVLNYASNNIAIYKNAGTGTFSLVSTYTASSAYSMTIGDFNHDGKVDLATVNYIGANDISVFMNTSSLGTPSYSTAVNYNGGSYPQYITSGDYNADGNIDLVIGSAYQVYELNGTSTGTFATATAVATYSPTPGLDSYITGDYNADGIADIAFSEQNNNALAIAINAKPIVTGTFTTCLGNPTTLTASNATTYSWSTGATTSTVSLNPSSTTVYTITGTSGSCSSATTSTVTVNFPPTLNASASPNIICAGATTTLTATGASTYTWSPGGAGQTITDSPTSTTMSMETLIHCCKITHHYQV